jgi:hypothetical protein
MIFDETGRPDGGNMALGPHAGGWCGIDSLELAAAS